MGRVWHSPCFVELNVVEVEVHGVGAVCFTFRLGNTFVTNTVPIHT